MNHRLPRIIIDLYGDPSLGGPSSVPIHDAARCRFNLSIYVYDDLPSEFTTDIEEYWTNETRRRKMATGGQWDDSNTEYHFVQLFKSSPCRTDDPRKANLFVVPYPHQCDCSVIAEFTGNYGPSCRQLPGGKMGRLFKWLSGHEAYASKRDQHVFFAMYHQHMLRPEVQTFPIRITSTPQHPNPYSPGQVVVPLINEDPKHRPSYLSNLTEGWWTRERKYAFAAVYGGMNMNMGPNQPRVYRRYFFQSLKKWERMQRDKGLNATVGGLPYVASFASFDAAAAGVPGIFEAYEDSVFCPILPGDMAHARRIFDAMARGCLPVLMRWPTEGGEKTWQAGPGSVPAKYNYPFGRALYGGDPFFMEDGDTIEYESFAVEAEGNAKDVQNYIPMIETMDSLISLTPNEIRERQLMLKKHVVSLMYGLGEDAHRFDDAFSRTMKVLEAYVHRVITGKVVYCEEFSLLWMLLALGRSETRLETA